MTIQILITLFSILVIAKAIGKFQNKEVHGKTVLLWSFFWLVVIFLIWQPNLTNYLAAFLGVTRGADAIFYLSLVIIFYLLFRMVTKVERIDADITTVVREIALLKNKPDPAARPQGIRAGFLHKVSALPAGRQVRRQISQFAHAPLKVNGIFTCNKKDT